MSTLTVWAPPLPPYFLSRWSSVSASSWQNSQHSPLNVSATASQDKQEEVQRHVNSNSWEEIILQNQVLILSTMYLYQEGWGEVEIIITGRFISGEFTSYLWISAKEIVNEEMLHLQLYEICYPHSGTSKALGPFPVISSEKCAKGATQNRSRWNLDMYLRPPPPSSGYHFTKIYMMTKIKDEGTEQSSMESKIKSYTAQGISLSSAPAHQSANQTYWTSTGVSSCGNCSATRHTIFI